MFKFKHLLGFSLIELMIVVSIIALLATIAIPSYQIYTKRARFTEIINAAELFKISVSLAIQQGIPAVELSNGQHGIPLEPKPTKNLASVIVNKGIISAIGTDLVNRASYILTPNENGTSWSISGTCLNIGLCNE